MAVRRAKIDDLSRVAEIYVFNNRVNYFPIFQDENFSFGELQVIPLVNHYFMKEGVLERIFVFDDGLIKGFVEVRNDEICKLYVDPFFQRRGIGEILIAYAIQELQANCLWALEKNTRAIAFYQRHGFHLTGEKKLEEGTTEHLVRLKR